MKIEKWTEDEIRFLRINYSFKSNKELAGILGKSLNSLKYKLKTLGLKKEKSIKVENKIKSSHANMIFIILDKFTMKELSAMTGYSTESIKKMKSEIKKSKENLKQKHDTSSMIDKLKMIEIGMSLVLEHTNQSQMLSLQSHINRFFGKSKFSKKTENNKTTYTRKA
jgi:hypothetical protein